MVEDRDTILELTGKIQEFQNEINCMNDSRDFQDAESIRSGNSHVTSRPVSFPPHPVPGMLSRSMGMPSQKWASKHLGHTWYIGKRFYKSSCVLFSTFSAGIESMELQNRRAASLIHSGKSRVRDKHKIKMRDASLDSQPKIVLSSVQETLQSVMGQTNNNDCRFLLHFDKFPTPATFACWKMKFKSSQFPAEGMQWINEAEISSSSIRGIQMPSFEVIDARIASTLNRIILISQFKRRISLEEQKAQKQDRFLRGRQIASLI